MADDLAITAETVERIAEEMLDLRLAASEREMVAGLLTSLRNDMRDMRRMDVGNVEPATVYAPREGGS